MPRGVAVLAKDGCLPSPHPPPKTTGDDPKDDPDGEAAAAGAAAASPHSMACSSAPPHAPVTPEHEHVPRGCGSGQLPHGRKDRQAAELQAAGMLALLVVTWFAFTPPRPGPSLRMRPPAGYYPGSQWPPWLNQLPDSQPMTPTPPPSHAGLAADFHDCEAVWNGYVLTALACTHTTFQSAPFTLHSV